MSAASSVEGRAVDASADASTGVPADADGTRASADASAVLHDYELSGNCYKVRLLAAMLGIAYRSETVEFYPAAAHKSEAFLAIDPMGELPVWVEGELVLRDSKAILVYLAARHDPDGLWYPTAGDPVRLARVVQWLAFGDALTASVSAARLVEGFFHAGDIDALRAEAHRLFRILDAHLWFGEREGRDWLVDGSAPTVADLACFPYVALSEEGGIDREDYPAIRRWLDRVTRLPGFVAMPGVFAAGAAR